MPVFAAHLTPDGISVVIASDVTQPLPGGNQLWESLALLNWLLVDVQVWVDGTPALNPDSSPFKFVSDSNNKSGG